MDRPLLWANLRTAALALLAPPLFLFLIAYLPGEAALFGVVAAIAIGLVGITSAPWPGSIRASVAAIYVLMAIPAAVFITLLAACVIGNYCL